MMRGIVEVDAVGAYAFAAQRWVHSSDRSYALRHTSYLWQLAGEALGVVDAARKPRRRQALVLGPLLRQRPRKRLQRVREVQREVVTDCGRAAITHRLQHCRGYLQPERQCWLSSLLSYYFWTDCVTSRTPAALTAVMISGSVHCIVIASLYQLCTISLMPVL